MIAFDDWLILPDNHCQKFTKAQLEDLVTTLRAEVSAAQQGKFIGLSKTRMHSQDIMQPRSPRPASLRQPTRRSPWPILMPPRPKKLPPLHWLRMPAFSSSSRTLPSLKFSLLVAQVLLLGMSTCHRLTGQREQDGRSRRPCS